MGCSSILEVMSFRSKMLGYVFLGGALGVTLRYFIFELIASNDLAANEETAALFVVNLLGSYFLGLTARHPYFQLEWCRNLWGLGFAGGFTTMSAVTLLADQTGITWDLGLMALFGLMTYAGGYAQGRMIQKRASL